MRIPSLIHLFGINDLFRLALRDIEVSIEAGYPKDLIFKLHERRFKCFKELKQLNNAFRSAKVHLNKLSKF